MRLAAPTTRLGRAGGSTKCFDSRARPGFTRSMKTASKCLAALVCSVLVPLGNGHAATPLKVIELWPKGPPGEKGEKGEKGEEQDMTKPSDGLIAGRPVIRLGNVS